jgi:hypothetical protein
LQESSLSFPRDVFVGEPLRHLFSAYLLLHEEISTPGVKNFLVWVFFKDFSGAVLFPVGIRDEFLTLKDLSFPCCGFQPWLGASRQPSPQLNLCPLSLQLPNYALPSLPPYSSLDAFGPC